MGTKEEINSMLDALSGESPNTDSPNTEPPIEDEVSIDPPVEDDEFETDPPVDDDELETDQPRTDAPTTDEPIEDDELTKLKAENEELRKKIDESSAPKTSAPKTGAPSTDAPIESFDFVGDEDIEGIDEDPQKFNTFLNKVYAKAIETLRKEGKESSSRILKEVPTMVNRSMTVQDRLNKLSNDFYEENPDLAGFKKTVGVIFSEVIEEKPNETFENILKDVESLTRDKLGLPKGAINPKKKDKDNSSPRLPRKRGGKHNKQPVPKTKGVPSEIDEMNKALGY